jgi:hypothetical protein
MRYSLEHLDELKHVPNVGMIIEQIDHAAKVATEEMRRYGQTLPSMVPMGWTSEHNVAPKTVPLRADVDTYLRFMVADAYVGFCECRAEADRDATVPIFSKDVKVVGIPDSEIEGVPGYDDPLFDVVVTGLQDAPAGFLTARISRRLTT